MDTEQESLAFIDECRFAVDQLLQTLAHRQNAIDDINRKLTQIEDTEKLYRSVFLERDQWSPNANYYYVQYIERMKALADEKEGIATEPERQERVRELLARIGATGESMAILAGAILQIGKQVLSFRFRGKPQLQNARAVGSQLVVELIWEGRNHALHWEEPKPQKPVKDMLQKLQQDKGVKIVVGGNNALAILAALGWSDTDTVINELRALVVAK